MMVVEGFPQPLLVRTQNVLGHTQRVLRSPSARPIGKIPLRLRVLGPRDVHSCKAAFRMGRGVARGVGRGAKFYVCRHPGLSPSRYMTAEAP